MQKIICVNNLINFNFLCCRKRGGKWASAVSMIVELYKVPVFKHLKCELNFTVGMQFLGEELLESYTCNTLFKMDPHVYLHTA